MPSYDLVPNLMSASDVLGTGWFVAGVAAVVHGKTVAVVGAVEAAIRDGYRMIATARRTHQLLTWDGAIIQQGFASALFGIAAKKTAAMRDRATVQQTEPCGRAQLSGRSCLPRTG
jgi:hypothetical protein